MSSSVKCYDSLDIQNFNYTKPEKFNNSYFGSMSYGDNCEPIYIQTPKLISKTNVKDVVENKTPYLEVVVPKNRLDFYDLFINIDDKNIKTTFSKSQEWFSKELPMDVIDEMHKPITKGFKKNSDPTIKFKIPIIKNKVQCTTYNQHKHFIDITDIKEGDELILILHLKGLKILKQHFYCECYISQIKLFVQKDLKYNIIDDYSIIDDTENEDDLDIFDEELLQEMNKEKELKAKKILDLKKELEESEKNILEKKKFLEELENN